MATRERSEILLRAAEKIREAQEELEPFLPESGEELSWIAETVEAEIANGDLNDL